MHSLLTIIAGKIIAIIAGLLCFKFLTTPYKIIFLEVVLALASESFGKYYSLAYHTSNAWIFNWYLLIEIWFNGLAGMLLIPSKTAKKIILFILILVSAIWLTNTWIVKMKSFANWGFIATSIALVAIYLSILFYNIFSSQSIILQPVFWLSLSIILFYGCDIPYFGLRNYLLRHSLKVEEQLYYVNYILNFIRYPLVAVSFILCFRNSRSKRQLEIA